MGPELLPLLGNAGFQYDALTLLNRQLMSKHRHAPTNQGPVID
jgi:hypothetical protein